MPVKELQKRESYKFAFSNLKRLKKAYQVVRYHDHRVKCQTQNEPIPDNLEWRIMQQNVGWGLWRIVAVFRDGVIKNLT